MNCRSCSISQMLENLLGQRTHICWHHERYGAMPCHAHSAHHSFCSRRYNQMIPCVLHSGYIESLSRRVVPYAPCPNFPFHSTRSVWQISYISVVCVANAPQFRGENYAHDFSLQHVSPPTGAPPPPLVIAGGECTAFHIVCTRYVLGTCSYLYINTKESAPTTDSNGD